MFRKFFGVCVALLVYIYCSRYNFQWFRNNQTDKSIYVIYQPIMFFAGAMTCGFTLAFTRFKFKAFFIITIVGSLICLIVSLFAFIA